jgi:uroporphyrinogen decarboxylase
MRNAQETLPFLQACHRKPTTYTPVWLMRQAGRYMKEYRALRKQFSFLEMCKNAELAAQVTLLPLQKFRLDAAIIFSDILLPLQPMGIDLEFAKNEGPVIHNPIRDISQVDRLRIPDPEEDLPFLMEAIRLARRELDGRIPLIGFSGAPFTLASYIIEGGHSRNFTLTKGMMYENPEVWGRLMTKLSDVLICYLNAQVQSGVEALQIFDSWVGCLSPGDYEEYVLPYSRRVISGLDGSVPLIHFATCSSTLLEQMKRAGGDVIGVDWRVDLKDAWSRIGFDTAIQGNLDPVLLLGPRELLEKKAREILVRAEGRPGHIFNLGHGILPNTPVDHVTALIDVIHQTSSK